MKTFSLLSLFLSVVAGTVPSCEGDGATTVRCFEETLTREVYDQKFQQVDSAEKLTELVKNLLDDRITKLNHPPANEEAEYAAFHNPEYVAYVKHYYAEGILTMLNYFAEYAAIRIKNKDLEESKNRTLAKTKFKETMQNINTLVKEFKGKIQQIYDEQKKKAEQISASPRPIEITEPSVSSEDNKDKLETEERDPAEPEEITENNREGNESDYESDEEGILEDADGSEDDGSDYESDEDSLEEILNASDDTDYANKL
ncbi:hypothetical protein DSO57_1016280 [Entomophthora muscae]|uniref:Uncharacterized protein n=1 Tax=Entomophthora muscae TaxID=34485 RepID=A0ACC2SHT6_9FUNG|nr:hypothetical protein DSO57_1016280 [Entomophthora muscae]